MATLLTNVKDLRDAYEAFYRAAYESGKKLDKAYNYQGGEGGGGEVSWYPQYRFWSHLEPYDKSAEWCWNIFGIENPNDTDNLTLTCEVNTLLRPSPKRLAGAFARDEDGRTLVVHTGKIGGGRLGIGKSSFWRLFPNKPVFVEREKKPTLKVAVVTILEEPDATARIAQFVWMVACIKATITIEQMRKGEEATER
jgi:hypothetical protein